MDFTTPGMVVLVNLATSGMLTSSIKPAPTLQLKTELVRFYNYLYLCTCCTLIFHHVKCILGVQDVQISQLAMS